MNQTRLATTKLKLVDPIPFSNGTLFSFYIL